MQEMERGFSLSERALLVVKAQDQSIEWYMKDATVVQKAVCTIMSSMKGGGNTATQTSLDHFFKRVDRLESSKEPEPVPSVSGVNDVAACPLSPVAEDPSDLPSPTSSPSSSQ